MWRIFFTTILATINFSTLCARVRSFAAPCGPGDGYEDDLITAYRVSQSMHRFVRMSLRGPFAHYACGQNFSGRLKV
jgi:hypothetical protein